MYDIFLYGAIAPSIVHVLDPKFLYPKPNTYAEVKESLPSIGGEAINTAIVLSKLGINTKFDGNWLNSNSNRVFKLMKRFNVDISRVQVKNDINCPDEIVITDVNSRTVFANYAEFHSSGRRWNLPNKLDIINAKMVVIDPYFREETSFIAKICKENTIPYITSDCKYDEFLAQNAECLVISHELIHQSYKDENLSDLFLKYQKNCTGLIIFTFGENELWYSRGKGEIKKFKPFKITPIDTTGAGDSFRAGITYGLFTGWDDLQTIEFACAVSACVCLTVPHTLNAYDLSGVLEFIKKNRK